MWNGFHAREQELRRRKARDPVEAAEKTPAIQGGANEGQAPIGLPKVAETPSRVRKLADLERNSGSLNEIARSLFRAPLRKPGRPLRSSTSELRADDASPNSTLQRSSL